MLLSGTTLPTRITESIPTEPPLTSGEVKQTTTSAEVSLTEGSDRPRTPENTSEEDSTSDHNDEIPSSNDGGSNHGETVAIILVSLLLILITAAVVGVIGYMLIRGQRERKSKTKLVYVCILAYVQIIAA